MWGRGQCPRLTAQMWKLARESRQSRGSRPPLWLSYPHRPSSLCEDSAVFRGAGQHLRANPWGGHTPLQVSCLDMQLDRFQGCPRHSCLCPMSSFLRLQTSSGSSSFPRLPELTAQVRRLPPALGGPPGLTLPEWISRSFIVCTELTVHPFGSQPWPGSDHVISVFSELGPPSSSPGLLPPDINVGRKLYRPSTRRQLTVQTPPSGFPPLLQHRPRRASVTAFSPRGALAVGLGFRRWVHNLPSSVSCNLGQISHFL